MFSKIMSQMKNKTIPLTPGSNKLMPKWYKMAVALKTWGLSGMAFGTTGFVLLCYITEWRAVLQYLPYYNGKYKELEILDKLKKIQDNTDNLERKENASRDFQNERNIVIENSKQK